MQKKKKKRKLNEKKKRWLEKIKDRMMRPEQTKQT